MALTTYGSVRSTVSGASVAAQAGGSTTQSKTLYCWISALNRVGASLPTSLDSVAIAADEKLVLTITADAWNTASEDCRAFLLSASETNDVSTATIIARVETRESKSISYQTGSIVYANEGTPKTFPLSLELTTDEQLKTASADLDIADESSYPTGADLVDGMIRRVLSLGSQLKQYRASAAEWQDVSGIRVNLTDTRQERSGELFCGGADQLVASAAELLYSVPPYPALDSSAQDPGLLLWFNNGLSFDGGDVVSAATQLLLELSQNDSTTLAPKLNEKVSATLLGYVDRATAALDTSMTDVGTPVYFNAAEQRLALPVDLPRGSAAIYLIQFRFKASEVDGIGLAPWKVSIRERGLVGTYNPSSRSAFVFDTGDRCLILPDIPNGIRRLGGRVHTGVYDSPTLTSSQSRFGLSANTAMQKAVLTADSGGDLSIKGPDEALRTNEGLRALVSTDGDSSSGLVATASSWSAAVVVNAGQLLQVIADYPCDEDGLGTVRANYPDSAIAGNSQGDFNPSALRVFARIGGVIYQKPDDVVLIPDSEQLLLISDDIVATWTSVAELPLAADADFCLWSAPVLTASAQSGSSAISAGTSVEIAVSYVFDGDEVTRISHAVIDGCMPIQAELTSLSSLASYFEIPQETTNQVRTIAQKDRNAYKELYCVQLGNVTRWDALETNLTELVFNFEDETIAGASDGSLRFNADLSEIYVSNLDEESLEVASVLSQIASGTQIQIDFEANSSSYRLAAATGAVVDNTTYYTIPISLVAQSGSLSAADTRVALSVDTSFIRPWDLSRAFAGRWVKDDSDQILSLQSNPATSLGEVGDLAVIINDSLTTYGDVLKKTAAATWTTLFNFLPYSQTTANFTQPALDASVVVSVRNSRLFPVDAIIFVEGGGSYRVVSKPDSTSVELRNISVDNATPGVTIPSSSRVYVSGPKGSKGDKGDAGSGLANLTGRAVSTNDTLLATDIGKIVQVDSANDIEITIPEDSSVAISIDSQLQIGRQGTGKVYLIPASNVLANGIDNVASNVIEISKQWGIATLRKYAANTWWISQDWGLTAAPVNLKNNLLSWYDLTEASGGIADQHSSNDLVEVGTVPDGTSTAGKGRGVFSDLNYFTSGQNAAFNFGSSGTPRTFYIATWVYSQSDGTLENILGYGNSNSTQVFNIQASTTNTGFSVTVGDFNDTRAVDAGGAFGAVVLPANQWSLIEVYMDQTTPTGSSFGFTMGIAVNGATFDTHEVTSDFTGETELRDLLAEFVIGIRNPGASASLAFTGIVGTTAIWEDIVLSDDARAAFYNSGNQLNYADL